MPAELQVYGTRQTMRELATLDKKLKAQAVRDIKAAAEPMRTAVAASIPGPPPLSGWAHKGRTGWTRTGTRVSTVYGGRARRDKEVWPLVSIVLKGAAASIWDMAGRASQGKSEQGKAMLQHLPGNASRSAWPTAERMLPATQAAVARAVATVEASMNRALSERPKGAR